MQDVPERPGPRSRGATTGLLLTMVGLTLGCPYKARTHEPYSGETYQPVDAATLVRIENGFARQKQQMSRNDDIVLLQAKDGQALKIEGELYHAVVPDPSAFTVGILIAPSDDPEHKLVLHERRMSTASQRDAMMKHLEAAPNQGAAYVVVRMDASEPDPFELHAIELADGSYLTY